MELAGFANDPKFDKPKQQYVNKPKIQYWNRLPAWLLPRDTPIGCRCVSHPQNLPMGVHLHTIHKYPHTPGKDAEEVLCTESYESVRKDPGTGQLIKKPCFWCDLDGFLREEQDGGILLYYETHDNSIFAAFESFSPFQCRNYIIPALLRARIEEVGDGEYKKTTVYPDNATISSVTLWVKSSDGLLKASPGGFIGALSQFSQQYKLMDSPDQGCWFTVVQASQQGFQFYGLEQPTNLYQTPMVPGFEKLMEHYPKPRTWGQISNKQKKSKMQSYNYSKRLFFNSDYGKDLIARFGVDPEWFQETQQDEAPMMAPGALPPQAYNNPMQQGWIPPQQPQQQIWAPPQGFQVTLPTQYQQQQQPQQFPQQNGYTIQPPYGYNPPF